MKIQKMLAGFLAVMMLLTMVSVPAFAADPLTEDDFLPGGPLAWITRERVDFDANLDAAVAPRALSLTSAALAADGQGYTFNAIAWGNNVGDDYANWWGGLENDVVRFRIKAGSKPIYMYVGMRPNGTTQASQGRGMIAITTGNVTMTGNGYTDYDAATDAVTIDRNTGNNVTDTFAPGAGYVDYIMVGERVTFGEWTNVPGYALYANKGAGWVKVGATTYHAGKQNGFNISTNANDGGAFDAVISYIDVQDANPFGASRVATTHEWIFTDEGDASAILDTDSTGYTENANGLELTSSGVVKMRPVGARQDNGFSNHYEIPVGTAGRSAAQSMLSPNHAVIFRMKMDAAAEPTIMINVPVNADGTQTGRANGTVLMTMYPSGELRAYGGPGYQKFYDTSGNPIELSSRAYKGLFTKVQAATDSAYVRNYAFGDKGRASTMTFMVKLVEDCNYFPETTSDPEGSIAKIDPANPKNKINLGYEVWYNPYNDGPEFDGGWKKLTRVYGTYMDAVNSFQVSNSKGTTNFEYVKRVEYGTGDLLTDAEYENEFTQYKRYARALRYHRDFTEMDALPTDSTVTVNGGTVSANGLKLTATDGVAAKFDMNAPIPVDGFLEFRMRTNTMTDVLIGNAEGATKSIALGISPTHIANNIGQRGIASFKYHNNKAASSNNRWYTWRIINHSNDNLYVIRKADNEDTWLRVVQAAQHYDNSTHPHAEGLLNNFRVVANAPLVGSETGYAEISDITVYGPRDDSNTADAFDYDGVAIYNGVTTVPAGNVVALADITAADGLRAVADYMYDSNSNIKAEKMIFAAYNADGKLIKAKIHNVNVADKATWEAFFDTNIEGLAKIRVFLWDNLDSSMQALGVGPVKEVVVAQ